MSRTGHVAIGFAPDGHPMPFTVAFRAGDDSEFKARMVCQGLVCRELVSSSVLTLPFGMWDHIGASGYSVKTFEVKIDAESTESETPA
ncbi:MAG: hypothetical protein KDK91_10975 [Gammaproteobacteria bacterium]|nr:hypothetical protein [Gammaproteobacteria bacterium]